jgi:hypothetical protein
MGHRVEVETSWPRLLLDLHTVLRGYVPGIGKRCDDSISEYLLSPEAFQAELTILGLSGRTFGPEDYAASLSEHLSLEIDVCVIPDADYPGLKRKWALLGPLAELRYVQDTGHVAVLVPGSLPPLALALTILHELGHLAAGDHLIDSSAEDEVEKTGENSLLASIHPGCRLAQRAPLRDERHREREADLRASYALIAGCLGADSPYALRMFDVL